MKHILTGATVACALSAGAAFSADEVRLQLQWVTQAQFAGYYAALDQGYYEDLGLDVDDFGLIFAYPWPGDEQVLEDLFDQYAATDSVLLTFHGIEDLKVQIKR